MSDDARSSPNWPEPTEEVELLRKQLREETDRAENLLRALEHARMIGTAMGIVLERQRVTSADAFEVLRRVSMNRNRKLHDVAREVVDTGVIPEAGTLRRVSAERGSRPGLQRAFDDSAGGRAGLRATLRRGTIRCGLAPH